MFAVAFHDGSVGSYQKQAQGFTQISKHHVQKGIRSLWVSKDEQFMFVTLKDQVSLYAVDDMSEPIGCFPYLYCIAPLIYETSFQQSYLKPPTEYQFKLVY